MQKQGGGPAIKDNKSSSGKSYGDLFVYEKSRRGNGLAVTGFRVQVCSFVSIHSQKKQLMEMEQFVTWATRWGV